MADKHQYAWLDDDAAERLLRGAPVPGQSGFGGARRERNGTGPTLADQGRSEAERIATAGVGGPCEGLTHVEDPAGTDDLGASAARPTAAGGPAGGGPATPGRGAPTTHDHHDQAAAQRLAAVLAAVAEDAIGPLARPGCEEGPLPREDAAVAAFRAARSAPVASPDGPRAAPVAPALCDVHGPLAGLPEGPRAGDDGAPLAAARDERGAAAAPGAAESASDARGASAKSRSTLATGRGRRTTGPSAITVVGGADTGPGRKGRPARGRPVSVRPLRAGLAAALVGCALGSVAVAAGTGVLPTPFRSDVPPTPAASVTAAGTPDGSVPQPKISGAMGTPSTGPSHARPPGDGTRPTESASAPPTARAEAVTRARAAARPRARATGSTPATAPTSPRPATARAASRRAGRPTRTASAGSSPCAGTTSRTRTARTWDWTRTRC